MNKINIQNKLEYEAVKCNKGICDSYEYCGFCKDKEGVVKETLTPCADAKEILDNITKELINYKKKVADLKIRKDRVTLWKEALNSNDIDNINELFDDTTEDTFGMPQSKNRRSSPIEQALIKKEVNIKQIEEWIKKEQDIINSIEYSVKRLEFGLEALTEEENFIITSKYIHKYSWLDIQENYNDKFRRNRNNQVTDKRLRNRCKEIKVKLYKIIHNY